MNNWHQIMGGLFENKLMPAGEQRLIKTKA